MRTPGCLLFTPSIPHYGVLTLDNAENETETDSEKDNYGFHYNIHSASHCNKILSVMILAIFSYFIGLGVAQCEHTHYCIVYYWRKRPKVLLTKPVPLTVHVNELLS